ncbi:MAG: hypothetical protein K1X79_02815 [Oligoflexia bacterium]|nr:hypothetical protein [Oligoflexia bacterium]
MHYRISLLLSALVALSLCHSAVAQIPAPLPPASHSYVTSVFFVPNLPPLCNGSGTKATKDCKEMAERLREENGKGTVTDAVREFRGEMIDRCDDESKKYPDYTLFELEQPGPILCAYRVHTECSFLDFSEYDPNQALGWCEYFIKSVSVTGSTNVTVTFDMPDLPCNCVGKKEALYCVLLSKL